MIADGLARFRGAFGRFQRLRVGAADLVLLLIKNPAGANEVLRILPAGEATLLFALNDRIADGRDVSWVWDVDWELVAPRLRHVVTRGDARRRGGAAAQVRGRRCGGDRGRARRRPRARPRRPSSPPAARATCCPPIRRCSSCRAWRQAAGSRDRTGRRPRHEARPLPALPRAPLDLRRSRQRPGHPAAPRMARARARGATVARGRDRSTPRPPTSTSSAAGRIATRCSWPRTCSATARRCMRPSQAAPPCSPCAAATSSPGIATSARTAARCRASACSTWRHGPAGRG